MAESLKTPMVKNKRYYDDKKRKKFNCQDNYKIKKQIPAKCRDTKTDIYVSHNSNFKGLFEKCEKLLKSGEPEIYIHGLGAAIPVAINLSLKIQHTFFEAFELSVNTSTVYLQDSFESTSEAFEIQTQTRPNSAVHIRIYQKAQNN